MQETWVQSLGWEDLLEKGMVTHSNILAWRIPRTGGVWQATVHGKYFCGDHFQAINVTSLNSFGKDNTVAHAVEYFSCTNTVTITQEHR